MTENEYEYIVEMKHITKRFPGIVANDDVSISIRRGEIFALLGENGAGKSTLMSMLFGMYEPDEGEILHHGTAIAGYLTQNMEELDIGGNILSSEELSSIEDKMREAEFKLATADAAESQ